MFVFVVVDLEDMSVVSTHKTLENAVSKRIEHLVDVYDDRHQNFLHTVFVQKVKLDD